MQRKELITLFVLLAALLAATLGGCFPKSTPPGASILGGGLEQTGYIFLQWKEGLNIMIWHDVVENSTCNGSGSTDDPIYRVQCEAVSQDGRQFDLDVQTADGKTAQLRIDGVSYALSNGALFIVTTKNSQVTVTQLQRNLGIQFDHESCAAFARGDPDLAKFIVGTSSVPTPTK